MCIYWNISKGIHFTLCAQLWSAADEVLFLLNVFPLIEYHYLHKSYQEKTQKHMWTNSVLRCWCTKLALPKLSRTTPTCFIRSCFVYALFFCGEQLLQKLRHVISVGWPFLWLWILNLRIRNCRRLGVFIPIFVILRNVFYLRTIFVTVTTTSICGTFGPCLPYLVDVM